MNEAEFSLGEQSVLEYFFKVNKPKSAPEIIKSLKKTKTLKSVTSSTIYTGIDKLVERKFLKTDFIPKKKAKVAYSLKEEFNTVFLPIARRYLTAERRIDFFASKFVQHFISDEKKIMDSIEENLGIKFDEKTRKHYYNIIKNSPSALNFGLFAKNTRLQERIKKSLKPDEESRIEIEENFFYNFLLDLKDKYFFLSKDFDEVMVAVSLSWKKKGKKLIDIKTEIPYKR